MRIPGCETVLHLLGLALLEFKMYRLNPMYPGLGELVIRRNELRRNLNQLLGRPVTDCSPLLGRW